MAGAETRIERCGLRWASLDLDAETADVDSYRYRFRAGG
jgi:hypothetical protein